MNCPRCNQVRELDSKSCICGLVFAPGCLMPLVLFVALHVAACFSFLLSPGLDRTAESDIYRLVALCGVFSFAILTYGIYRRKFWSLLILKIIFTVLIVIEIMALMGKIPGYQPTGFTLIMTVLRCFVVVYLNKPELKEYFKVQKSEI